MDFSKVDELFAERILLPFPDVNEKAKVFLGALMQASREGHLCIPSQEKPPLPEVLFKEIVVWSGGRCYLRRNWECEQRFLEAWKRLKRAPPALNVDLKFENNSLLPEQEEALKKCAESSLSIICGGPGTGKTYTAAKLIEKFKGQKIALTAPTGKAAAHLKSAVSVECMAKTLHALLKEEKRLPFDLVVVDEGSMIDAEMMARLFSSIKEGARLVLLGDPDQLPPVESGNFFADLLEQQRESVTYLKRCMRAELQEIIDLAAAVKRGESVPSTPLPPLEELVEAILQRFDPKEPERFRVLTPLRRGLYGVEYLNRRLDERAPKEAPRPMMIRVNDPKLGLFNGDMGLLQGEEATFSGGRTIPRFLLPRFELAYVLSVHKSQGSEYDEVWLLLPQGAENFGREMFYTAITRARKKVTIFAETEIQEKILNSRMKRLSGVSL